MHFVNDVVGNTWPHARTHTQNPAVHPVKTGRPVVNMIYSSKSTCIRRTCFQGHLGFDDFIKCQIQELQLQHLHGSTLAVCQGSLETFEELIVPSEIVVRQARFAHKSFRVCTWILSLQCLPLSPSFSSFEFMRNLTKKLMKNFCCTCIPTWSIDRSTHASISLS